MTFEEFLERISQESNLDSMPVALRALGLERNGTWEEAHQCAQSDNGVQAAWVHAYLHRLEGDIANADYWYRRAGKERFVGELNEEWEAILRSLLVD